MKKIINFVIVILALTLSVSAVDIGENITIGAGVNCPEAVNMDLNYNDGFASIYLVKSEVKAPNQTIVYTEKWRILENNSWSDGNIGQIDNLVTVKAEQYGVYTLKSAIYNVKLAYHEPTHRWIKVNASICSTGTGSALVGIPSPTENSDFIRILEGINIWG